LLQKLLRIVDVVGLKLWSDHETHMRNQKHKVLVMVLNLWLI